MKRLFTVRDPKGKCLGVFYSSKTEAKEHRDGCNKKNKHTGYTVSPGPDHWRNQS